MLHNIHDGWLSSIPRLRLAAATLHVICETWRISYMRHARAKPVTQRLLVQSTTDFCNPPVRQRSTTLSSL